MAVTFGSALMTLLLLQPATRPSVVPTPPAQQGDVAPAANVDPKLASLIKQLGDPDVAVRDAAQAGLKQLGEVPAELLQKARDGTSDPDVQLRLDSLIVFFAENDAIGATRITLKYDNTPLKEVLDDFERQGQANFIDPGPEFGNEPPRITINLQNVSFWQAISALQNAGNLNIFPQPDGWRVMRNFGNPLFGSNAIEAGAFLIQPMSANYQRNIAYARNMGGGESFSISMQLMTEPKIRLAQAQGQFKLIEAVDSNGNSLLGPNSVQPFVTGIGQSQIHMQTQLAYPKNPGEKIARLTGSIKLNMARQVQSIGVDDFGPSSKPIEQTFESAKITLSPGDANAGQPNWVQATIVLESPNDPQLMQRLTNALHQVRLVDAKARPFQIVNFQQPMASQQRTEIRVSFMPQGNAEASRPYRLSLEIPTSFREIEVPFTLTDLKMP